MSDAAIAELAPKIGVRNACDAVGVAQASYYRRHRRSPPPQRPAPLPHQDRPQPRALSESERAAILDELHSERFVDMSPTEVWATLLDEGRYLGSISTFYRLLRQAGESRERRRQATHPAAVKPELVAYQPNSVWSWDITKLRGPAKWSWYYLYVILDIFSRYVVGWMVATRESAALAEVLIRQTCAKQGIGRDQLTIHADRGSSMTSKPVAFLLADLGVTQSHSRPHVSDDNPFSEAQFKTLKYRPDFPDRFDSIEAARRHCQTFFGWYNDEHRHTGLALHVPADVHYGTAAITREKRAGVLDAAYAAHPERFVRKPPQPPNLPRFMDQQARRHRGGHSVNTAERCLIQVDRFRTACFVVGLTEFELRPLDPQCRFRRSGLFVGDLSAQALGCLDDGEQERIPTNRASLLSTPRTPGLAPNGPRQGLSALSMWTLKLSITVDHVGIRVRNLRGYTARGPQVASRRPPSRTRVVVASGVSSYGRAVRSTAGQAHDVLQELTRA